MTERVRRASGQDMRSMMPTMASEEMMLPKISRTPEVNISLRASTSEVTRVTRRPTGLRSKKATSWNWMWRKISRRRSNMIFWPVHCMR